MNFPTKTVVSLSALTMCYFALKKFQEADRNISRQENTTRKLVSVQDKMFCSDPNQDVPWYTQATLALYSVVKAVYPAAGYADTVSDITSSMSGDEAVAPPPCTGQVLVITHYDKTNYKVETSLTILLMVMILLNLIFSKR